MRTGLIRPILAGDTLTVNPWDGETSVAKILSDAGYYSLLTGKWHIGEGKGMRPHEVGFDEYYGYLPAQKEITQAIDPRRYPDLALDADKLNRYESIGAEHALIHGFKGGETKTVSSVQSLEEMGIADEQLVNFSCRENYGASERRQTVLPGALLHESAYGQLRQSQVQRAQCKQVRLQRQPLRG